MEEPPRNDTEKELFYAKRTWGITDEHFRIQFETISFVLEVTLKMNLHSPNSCIAIGVLTVLVKGPWILPGSVGGRRDPNCS